MKKDFGLYLEYLGRERFRSIIIHNDKLGSLSQFAVMSAKAFKGKYINLIEYFKNHSELAQSIDTFSFQDLFILLQNESQGESLLIVDNANFLLDTWQRNKREAFHRMVKNQWDSYKDSMKTILVFCLHSSEEIVNLKTLDSQGNERINPLSSFKSID